MKSIYFDVETTGIPCPQSGLIQLAGIIEIDGRISEQFSYRIGLFPEDQIEDEALQLNGVTRDELMSYEEPQAVFERFIELLSRYVDRFDREDKFQLVGYNARFDADHLRAWFKKNGDQFFGSWFWHPPLDVMSLAAVLLRDRRYEMRNFKLATVARQIGLSVDEQRTHEAGYDVCLTRDLFMHLIEMLDMIGLQ